MLVDDCLSSDIERYYKSAILNKKGENLGSSTLEDTLEGSLEVLSRFANEPRKVTMD